MGWFSSDEPEEEVQVLIDNARHDSVTAEILCNKDSSGWLGYDYLNDRPLIEHLDEEEQPHFITNMTDMKGAGIFTESHEELQPNGKLRTIIAVTNQRILCVIGDEDGDRKMVINYDEILDIDANIKPNDGIDLLEMSIVTEQETYYIRQTRASIPEITDDEIVEYITKQVPNYEIKLSDGTEM
jgi:hypothetical protein